jgi:hypothetical protein
LGFLETEEEVVRVLVIGLLLPSVLAEMHLLEFWEMLDATYSSWMALSRRLLVW